MLTNPYCLSDLGTFVSELCDASLADFDSYISTESMIPNCGGVQRPTTLPSNGLIKKYQIGDILISNIRPYFRKIWHSNKVGTCSTDILVFRSNEPELSDYVYAVISNYRFIDFIMSGVKGTKMPRGDVAQILQYPIYQNDKTDMIKIGTMIAILDNKIELNQRVNDNLGGVSNAS